MESYGSISEILVSEALKKKKRRGRGNFPACPPSAIEGATLVLQHSSCHVRYEPRYHCRKTAIRMAITQKHATMIIAS